MRGVYADPGMNRAVRSTKEVNGLGVDLGRFLEIRLPQGKRSEALYCFEYLINKFKIEKR